MSLILNAAPCFEEVTEHSFAWNQRLMEKLPQRKEQLLKEDAVRAKFEQKVQSLKPDFFVFYNHGSETQLVGNDEQPIVDLGNVQLLKGLEVYTLACLSAKELGVEAWRQGAKAYWGNDDEFGFTDDEEQVFEELAGHGLLCRLLKGMSWADAKKEVIDKYNYEIDKANANFNFIASMILVQNRDSLRVWNGEQPETQCLGRKLAIKLFGPKRGWKLLGGL